MAETIKTEVKEVKAFARGVHISPRKARLVANLIKKLPVERALAQLQFTTARATLPIKKLLDSAVANASHNFQIDADRLYIKNITVDGAQVMMRYKPRAQGRAFPVRKRTSHLSLILGVKPGVAKKKAEAKKEEKVEGVKPQNLEEKEETKPVEQPPKRRFDFFRRKPKQEFTKGKKYTGFDRRSGS